MDPLPIKILIVDDHPSACTILKDYLKSVKSVSVCGIAFNGKQAWDLIQFYKPDMILLDIVMPEIDGLSLLERLNQEYNPNTFQKPVVIILTSLHCEIIKERALQLGASYYLMKPYSLDHLMNCITLLSQPILISYAETETKLAEPEVSEFLFEASITSFLMSAGMATHMIGYRYCIQAVEFLLAQSAYSPLMKCVYPVIATKNNTTTACVESALRKVISTVTHPDLKGLSNRSFLSRVAEQIRVSLEYSPDETESKKERNANEPEYN